MKNSSMMTAIRLKINRLYHRWFAFGRKVVLLKDNKRGLKYSFLSPLNDDDEEEWGIARAWKLKVVCTPAGGIYADGGAGDIRGTWKLVRSWKPPLELNLKAKNAIRSS